MYKYISSEEKSFLNVSITDYPKHGNSPESFVDEQRAVWSRLWCSEAHRAETTAAFLRLRSLVSQVHANKILVDHSRFVSSARSYKKVSKGSDHFLASELAYMPSVASGGIVDAINLSNSLFVMPRQLLCNLHPLLGKPKGCLLYTSPSPRDATLSRMPSSA